MRTAALLAAGDELLSGTRREGNCAFMAGRLNALGWVVPRIEVVSDEVSSIVEALGRWVGNADVVVLSGGLGPTHDDRTRAAVAEYLLSRPGARVDSVPNPVGTAPGIFFEAGGTRFWSLPGVPGEYRVMAEVHILPALDRDPLYECRSVSVVGLPETRVVALIPEVISNECLHVSVLPSSGVVELVLKGDRSAVEAAERLVRGRMPDDVLPSGCANLPEAVLSTGVRHGLTVCCAESCTGGMVGAALTEIPGSSAVFAGSAVVYSNEAKTRLLGVDASVIESRGAVSRECAEGMAVGAVTLYGGGREENTLSVSVTGVAGPDGGSDDKPIGTVWFAVARGTSIVGAFERRFAGDRADVRERSVKAALAALWRGMNGCRTGGEHGHIV
ncbi:MAG: nicotinamide-nucleotide amidohydrolase family protein [Synergistaceae bacterium]|jgi:nicotinamide-nucleotide amidase|nr:nicotinamide-nucleotide amidohydrolase family protein [Synergistaceae bacterium]